MINRYITIVLMAVALVANAQDWQTRKECEQDREKIHAPYYYCDCHMDNHVFSFPLDTVINDTTWYTATMDDLRQGISAYWFADCSVTIEIYAFCTGYSPIFTMTVGRNQMRDVDAEFINKKISEAGDQFAGSISSLTPHMRVFPNKKNGSGRVYCYPYDQGPESTCEDPMELRPGMTYVCEKQENVYQLKDYTLLPATGKALVHWKQKKNQPCEMWLTLDSCTGKEVDRFSLSDSLHVHMLDSALLMQTRKDKKSLWLHVKHAKDIVGRVRIYNNPEYTDPAESVNQSICKGKSLSVNGRTYSTDTTFTDTLWLAVDTMQTMRLQTMDVNFSFTIPQLEYDTVYVLETEITSGYRYKPTGTTLYAFGDTILEAKKKNTCSRLIQLTLVEKDPNEGIEETYAATRRPYKQIRDGQLFIIIDDRRYTLFGQQTK